MEDKKTVSEISKEGFKVNYNSLRKKLLQCEINKESGRINDECRRAFKELGISVIDNE